MISSSAQPSVAQELAPLFSDIAAITHLSRHHIQQAVKSAMVQCHWHIGRLIVEHEQQGQGQGQGQARAAYGKRQLEALSEHLTTEFGKGFDISNLRNMRSFFLCFPKWDPVSLKLNWTHYRKLIRLENPNAKDWYKKKRSNSIGAPERWNGRSTNSTTNACCPAKTKRAVRAEAERRIAETEHQALSAKDYLRDPYILGFLNLPSQRLLIRSGTGPARQSAGVFAGTG